jgi:protein-S-isoprenylcysteine O-methyltransferase Ste14
MTRLHLIGWIACVMYSTVPSFWLLVHPFAEHWRSRKRSPYFVLLPAWITMWGVAAAVTSRWYAVRLYETPWTWLPAGLLFIAGFWLYSQSLRDFSAQHLGGIPEVVSGRREQRLVTSGIRARVRHPVYLAHLCEMLAWSVGTGLVVCYGLTAFAMVTGAVMIRMEDAELEKRFGEEYGAYRRRVPAVWPRVDPRHSAKIR